MFWLALFILFLTLGTSSAIDANHNNYQSPLLHIKPGIDETRGNNITLHPHLKPCLARLACPFAPETLNLTTFSVTLLPGHSMDSHHAAIWHDITSMVDFPMASRFHDFVLYAITGLTEELLTIIRSDPGLELVACCEDGLRCVNEGLEKESTSMGMPSAGTMRHGLAGEFPYISRVELELIIAK
ncbi:hypothetical protein B0J14DRAFT_634998 [Halenospora varia]|nr:hypothetical protein B0J14DRAFT_634998 [Halenospora varia]